MPYLSPTDHPSPPPFCSYISEFGSSRGLAAGFDPSQTIFTLYFIDLKGITIMQKLKASFKCAYVFCTKVTLSLLLPFLCDTSGDLG